MVRAIWVEDINDMVERTEVLKKEMEKYGYKLSLNDLADVLTKRMPKEKVKEVIDSLKDRKIGLIMAVHEECPTMVGYGTMRLENKNGFYISYLKKMPDGTPEIRLIIENKKEFRTWLRCFAEQIQKQYIKIKGASAKNMEKSDMPDSYTPTWGDKPSKCPICGNTDINKILVWFSFQDKDGKDVADATNIGKFFYEWKKLGFPPLMIDKITCLKCTEEKRGGVEIDLNPYQI